MVASTKSEPMEDREIVAFLAGKIDQALNDDDGDLSASRQENLDYYLGEPHGDERTGYSQYRSREVLETVEWCLPALLRIFTAGDRVVSFSPGGLEDEAQAEQETEAVNEALMQNGEYFLTVYNWIKSALLEPVAYVKTWMEKTTEVKGEEYAGLTEAELAQLVADKEVEVLEQSEYPDVDPLTGQPIVLYSLKVRRTCTYPRLRVEPTPGEETLIDESHTRLCLDEAEFTCHRVRKTYSWLVSNGYDREALDDINPEAGREFGGEKANRLFTEDESWSDDDDGDDPSLRTFWVHECSVLLDVDGDGIAERRQIVLIGDKVFDNEEYDHQPLVPLCAIPMPHRHPGLAEADLVKDLQRLRSTLIRQLLDNIYRVNRPKQRVGVNALTDDGKTLQSLLDPLAEYIPCEDPNAIVAEVQSSFVGELLPVIQFFSESQQTRTGVAPQMSLDPNVLQQSTAGAFQGALEQASQRLELIARIFAETGFKWLALKVHRLLKEHSQRPIMLKRRGQWMEVNPADWRDRQNVTVHVGLGFNDKTKEVMLAQTILAAQQAVMASPMGGAGIVTPENVLNALEDLVTANGKKAAERYFSPPQPPQPPAPDPNMVLAQAQAQAMQLDAESKMLRAQVEQMKAQVEAQAAQVEQQGKQQELALKAREDELKLQGQMLEFEVKRAKAGAEIANIQADTALKEAQRIKALADAQSQQMDNEAVRTGVMGLLEGRHVAAESSALSAA